MNRRQQRAQRQRDEARGVDTRTGELPDYPCPPHLLAPAGIEEWLTPEELATLTEAEAMLRARRRWVDARDDYAREQTGDDHGLRARVARLCGPVGRPVWRDEVGEPWRVRRRATL
jgi:hypothetical protein